MHYSFAIPSVFLKKFPPISWFCFLLFRKSCITARFIFSFLPSSTHRDTVSSSQFLECPVNVGYYVAVFLFRLIKLTAFLQIYRTGLIHKSTSVIAFKMLEPLSDAVIHFLGGGLLFFFFFFFSTASKSKFTQMLPLNSR